MLNVFENLLKWPYCKLATGSGGTKLEQCSESVEYFSEQIGWVPVGTQVEPKLEQCWESVQYFSEQLGWAL